MSRVLKFPSPKKMVVDRKNKKITYPEGRNHLKNDANLNSIQRIRVSLNEINKLMRELKEMNKEKQDEQK